jgi:Asp-tRNA(Asn)/Glu-tRNA(Gln) amidotransferase A subunit family amidase
LVGLRPTHGLLDLRGVAPLAPSTDTVGPIARCVEDVATILAILSGSPRSAWLAAEPGLRRGLQGARLGVLRQAFGTDAAIGSVIEAALAQMAGAGAILIDPVHLPDELLPIDRPLLVDWEFRPAFDAYLRDRFAPGTAPASLAEIVAGGEFLPDYRDALQRRLAAESPPCPAYLEVVAYHDRLRNALGAVMAQHRLDAIVHPTSMVLPTSLDNPATGWAPELAACCGWPALTVPAGRSERGLPIGIEFLGRAHTEAGLLAIGHAFESLRGGRAIPDLASAGH